MIPGLVSIITPTYNHEKFLANCLDSIISQTYAKWEVIIIDDGSIDNTGTIGRQYAKKYHNIRYIFQENIGPYRLHETYNKGLGLAQGEFIAILEGDDYWYPTKLELQIKALQKNPKAILSWGRVHSIHALTLQVINEHPTKDKNQIFFNNLPVGSILQQLYIDNCIPALTIVIKTEKLKAIGGFGKLKNLPLVDYPTLLELSTIGSFEFVNEFLGAWRIYPQQVTKSHTVNIRQGLYEYAQFHYKKNFGKKNPIINKMDWDYFHKKFLEKLIIAYARSGRYKLIRKDFKGARADYQKVLSSSIFKAPIWKLRALIGLLFSYLHMDVEGLAKIFNKTSYK